MSQRKLKFYCSHCKGTHPVSTELVDVGKESMWCSACSCLGEFVLDVSRSWQDENRTETSVEQVYATRYDCPGVRVTPAMVR